MSAHLKWWHTCTCVCMDLLLTCDIDVLVLFIGVEQAHWRACLFYTFNKGIITMLFYTDVISNINVTLICLFVICEKVQWNQTKITCRHYSLKVSHFLQQKNSYFRIKCWGTERMVTSPFPIWIYEKQFITCNIKIIILFCTF